MFLARFNQSRLIGLAQILLGIAVLVASCTEKKESGAASGGGETYYHPTVATAPTTSVSASRSTAKDLSLTQDLVLQLGTVKVTIPKGAVHELGTASLQNYEGPFINTSSMRMVSESMLLVIRKIDATDFARTEIFKDIVVEQTTSQKTSSTKMVQLYQEDAELAAAAKTGLSQKSIKSYYTDQGSGQYVVTAKVRHPRIAFVVAEATSGALPSGFSAFIEPAKDPTVVSAVSTTPADVTLTWSGDPRFNDGYGVVYYAAGSTALDCTYKNVVTATTSTTISVTTSSADYTYSVTGLLDATTYTFKVCGLSPRTDADASVGATVDITMPARAHAVLTNAPSDPSNTAALNITVGGTNVVAYQYAVVSGQTNCSGATFGSWTAIATPITDSIPLGTGTQMTVCVLGKIDSTNLQLISTDVSWVVDKTPPTFTSLALVAPALDGYLSTADRTLTTVIAGTLTASGHDATLNKYVLVTAATTCNGSLTYVSSAPAANSSNITVDGSYKICGRIVDQAGNITYGASSTFVVDTTISFTAATLANQAADTYINLAENSLTGNLVNAATGVGFSTAKYALVPIATTCNSSVTYAAAVPKSNNAAFGADGDYAICVDLSDAAGNHAYGSSATIHLKKAVPAFTSISLANAAADTYINAADHLLISDLSSAAVGSNYNTLQYGIQTSAAACSAIGVWSTSIPHADSTSLASDGASYKVCAKFSDNAGNPAAYGNTASFLYDVTAPVFTSSPLANDALDGYLSNVDRAGNLAVIDVAVSTGSDAESYSVQLSGVACNNSLTYTAGLVLAGDSGFASDAAYKVCVRLTDLAGNVTYGASSSITRVSDVPDCTGITLANDASDGWINLTESVATNALSTSASTTLASPIRTYAIIAAAAACDQTASFGAQDVIPASNTAGLTEGSGYKVCAKVTDVAMNTPAYCATATLVTDLTAPVFTSLPLANSAADTYVNIADHSLTTAVAGPLTATGQASAGYLIAAAATTCDGLLTYGGTIPLANDTSLATSGSYKVCVKIADAAGNATYDQSPTFTSDQIAPIFTSFDLANEASDGYINIADASSGLDSANNLIVSGEVTTEYATVASAAACSTGTYGATIPVISAIAGLGDGPYKICVHLVDVSANETYGGTSSVTVDLAAPGFTSIAATGDAADTYINAVEHTHSTAMASAAVGTGQDVISYALVADGTACSAVVSWVTSIPAGNNAGFTTDGDYIICVKLTDYAGNPAAYGSSSAIHLKTDYPVFTSIDLANEVADLYMNANDHTLANSLVTNLVGSGYTAATYVVATSAVTCNASLTYGAMKLQTDAAFSAANTFKVCIALVDVAGNITYGASSTFDYDPTAPIFTSLALLNDAADSYLNATENATANDLAGSLSATGYTAATYVVAASSTTCDGALAYGLMPKSNDAAITDAGTWKICVKLADAAGNLSYGGTTSTFLSKFAVPAFTSVVLTGTAADGFVNAADVTGATDLVTAATGSNFDTAQYSVVATATACSAATFAAAIPKTNAAALSSDAVYKVCAKLMDTAGNTPAYGSSATFVLDTTKPTSTVTTSGAVLPSTTPGANTTISGTAADAGAGVASVSVSVQEGTGSCYSASTNDFSATCPNWLAATGTTAWSYDLPDNALLKGVTYAVQVRATDAAVSTGNIQTAFGSGSFSFTASEGDELWTQAVSYDGGAGDDRPTAAAVDSSGNLFVVGYHTATDRNWLIKKYDVRGNEETTHWNKDVGDVGSDEIARGIALDTSNNVYVVGSRHNGSNLDWWLKKYSSTGTEDLVNWDIILDGGTGDDEAMGVTTDTSGNIYVVGYGSNLANGVSGKDTWIRKYSSAGVLGCEQKIDGGANLNDAALAVAVNSTTSKLYVAGYQTGAGPDQQLVLRRLRTSDCTVEITVSGNSVGSDDQAASVKLDSAGNVYVAGRNSATDSDWWIRKYSAALALQTDYSSNVASSHEALALAIDASNNVYAGGYKTAGTQNWWLRKFSNTLVEDTSHWDKTFDANAGNDQITAMIIGTGANDIGSVYVIGWGTNVVNGASGSDWWVRKFSGP